MNNRHPDRRFTLIELLVVVAIIAVLASLLLPALGQARKAARRVECMSRLKNLNLSTAMYRDDNDQFFPMNKGYQSLFGARCTWASFIRPYTPLAGNTTGTILMSARDNYMLCPALRYDIPPDGNDPWNATRPQGLWYDPVYDHGWIRYVGTYYTSVYYGQQDLYDDGPSQNYRACKPKRATHNLVSPDRRILIGEANLRISGSVISRFGYTNNMTKGIEYPHEDKTNILSLDGHVATYRDFNSYPWNRKPVVFYDNAEVQGD